MKTIQILHKHRAILLIPFLFFAHMFFVVSAEAKEVSVSQIQAWWNPPSRTQYRIELAYPRSMVENPPTITWSADLPCGSLIESSRGTVFWDQSVAGSDRPACEQFGEKNSGIIVVDVRANNGEEYTCFFNGAYTGTGVACQSSKTLSFPDEPGDKTTGPVVCTSDDAGKLSCLVDGKPVAAEEPKKEAVNQMAPEEKGSGGHTGLIVGGLAILVVGVYFWKKKNTSEKIDDDKPKDDCKSELRALEVSRASLKEAEKEIAKMIALFQAYQDEKLLRVRTSGMQPGEEKYHAAGGDQAYENAKAEAEKDSTRVRELEAFVKELETESEENSLLRTRQTGGKKSDTILSCKTDLIKYQAWAAESQEKFKSLSALQKDYLAEVAEREKRGAAPAEKAFRNAGGEIALKKAQKRYSYAKEDEERHERIYKKCLAKNA